jgi:acetyl-CoA carboxylase biotin carboxyl carrier protein
MTTPKTTTTKSTAAFDPDLVRALAGLLTETGLTEIEYDTGGWRVRVARTPAPVAAPPAATPTGAAPETLPAGVGPPFAVSEAVLTSPMVGVVYTAPEPGAPPYVQLGDAVAAGATVLLIEAMKVFNPIKAHRAGTVTRILVTGGTPVEYGEPLMVIE